MDNPIPKFERLQRALAEMSPARRMVAGTLVAVMIATGVWAVARVSSSVKQDAAGRVMEPVLDQTFAKADVDRIIKHLNDKKIPHEIADGGRVLVRADQRLEVLSDLFYAGVLGGAGSGNEGAFDTMVKQMTAWDPPSKTDKMFNRYREEKVEQVVAHWPGVRKTTVIIDPTSERRLGGESVQSAAMIDIQTRGDGSADPRQLSQAAANVLTGVIAGLTRDRVRVTIDGATFNADAVPAGGASSGDMVARKHQCEQMHVAKVRQLLSYIPGDVLVSVSVDLDVPAVDADPAETDAKAQATSEVVANAVPAVMEQAKKAPVRSDVVRSASVAVPRSYFVRIYRRATAEGTKEPTDALLQPIVDAYSVRIRNLVKNGLGVETDAAVTVEHYEDTLPAAGNAAVASSTIPPWSASGVATAGSPAIPVAAITTNLNTYAREIALVTLAAVTLLALSLIVRRRPVPVMVDTHGRQHVASPGALSNDVVDGTLEDLDDSANLSGSHDDFESHQLFRRVRDMSQERPDDAARVLRSWIYQQD